MKIKPILYHTMKIVFYDSVLDWKWKYLCQIIVMTWYLPLAAQYDRLGLTWLTDSYFLLYFQINF